MSPTLTTKPTERSAAHSTESTSATRRQDEGTGGRRVVLEPDEVELLLKVCHIYQASLPTYLQSTKPEVDLLDSIGRKLRGES